MDKVFIFKMSEVGPGSSVDLVKQMQAGGDLECAWMIFDHVKRVKEWTTMACHVYNTLYCKVMTIAVCDMQLEDCTAQVIFWRNLNLVVQRNGLDSIEFEGFMADSAQANWNAVQIVYGRGDPIVPIENCERTAFSTGRSPWRSTRKPTLEEIYKSSIGNSAGNTRMLHRWMTLSVGSPNCKYSFTNTLK